MLFNKQRKALVVSPCIIQLLGVKAATYIAVLEQKTAQLCVFETSSLCGGGLGTCAVPKNMALFCSLFYSPVDGWW